MAAQTKAICDQVVIALKLKIKKNHRLLSPEDGSPIDASKVENRVLRMEEDFADFKRQNANYIAVAGITYDEDTVDTLYRDCYDARETLIDLYHDSMPQDDPAEVGPTTNNLYDWVNREVLVLQGEIDERIRAVRTGIDTDGPITSN